MSSYFDVLKTQWLPVYTSTRLKKKPVPVQVLGQHVVVYRLKNKVAALKDQCPHRSAPLSEGRVVGDGIQCPYHGWRFDAAGVCKHIPGTDPSEKSPSFKVQSYDVMEKGGLIWIRLTSKDEAEPNISDHITNTRYNTRIWTDEINASLINALENFLDGTHTHYVHAGLLRSEKARKEIIADITPFSDKVEIIYKNEGKQNGVLSKWLEPERSESKASFIRPCVAELTYSDKKGPYFVVTAYLVPITETRLKVFALLSHRKGLIPGFFKHLVVYPFFKMVLNQDKRILMLQQECIERLGKESVIKTELDLMRPYMHQLLQGESIATQPPVSKVIYL